MILWLLLLNQGEVTLILNFQVTRKGKRCIRPVCRLTNDIGDECVRDFKGAKLLNEVLRMQIMFCIFLQIQLANTLFTWFTTRYSIASDDDKDFHSGVILCTLPKSD